MTEEKKDGTAATLPDLILAGKLAGRGNGVGAVDTQLPVLSVHRKKKGKKRK